MHCLELLDGQTAQMQSNGMLALRCKAHYTQNEVLPLQFDVLHTFMMTCRQALQVFSLDFLLMQNKLSYSTCILLSVHCKKSCKFDSPMVKPFRWV